MRKKLLYGVVLLMTMLIPTERTDLEKLKPVEALYLYVEEGDVTILTDTGNRGSGTGVEQAIKNLQDRTAGVIYLDTANFLLTTKEGQLHITELARYLKGTVRVCRTEGEVDMEQVGAYLSVHRPQLELRDWTPDRELPVYPVEKK